MRILSYVKSMDGCSYHRIYQQNNHTDHEVRVVNNITEEDLIWCDVLNYSRHCLYAPEFLDKMRKQHNFKIVVDTDDCWIAPEWHPLHGVWKNGELSRQVENHLRNADAVTVTHQRLKDLIVNSKINENVFILPNTLPYGEGQYNRYFFPEQDKVRLLYASSEMNYVNTKMMVRVMKKLAKLPIEVVLAGGTKNKWFDQTARDLTDNGRIPNRIYPWQPIDNYMKCYEGDIMLLPCVESEFMSYKSNLKLLEAASAGMPVVVSPVDPYLNMPVTYAHGEKQWVEKITELVLDKELRKKRADELDDFCWDNYNMNNRSHIYELI